ncbi:MAG: universal stress protein [Bacteroidetes bacterium]|nr:universal stress protein [Bacteroidota bacterium]
MKAKKISTVLIALDYNPTSQKVAEAGFSLAQSMGAECILLHVISDLIYYTTPGYTSIMGFDGFPETGLWAADTIDELKKGTLKFLDKTRTHLGDQNIQTLIAEGDVAAAVLKTASEVKADIIVIGSHSQKWLESIVIGSVAEEILRQTPISLFIVPTKKK